MDTFADPDDPRHDEREEAYDLRWDAYPDTPADRGYDPSDDQPASVDYDRAREVWAAERMSDRALVRELDWARHDRRTAAYDQRRAEAS